ncbi:MAG: hypothetical protein GY773_33450, partial [Actinomycetia bacterium]|nr:hypothetical protein [Actinomycetes bacterium]
KLGIGIILVGILVRLWLRVESVKTGLSSLKPSGDGQIHSGSIKTAFGPATASAAVPKTLPIHKMARTMWAPMLAMGYMLLIGGLIASFVWSANVGMTDRNPTYSVSEERTQHQLVGSYVSDLQHLNGSRETLFSIDISLPHGADYTAHLVSGDVNTLGASLIGLPYPLVGHNTSAAWAIGPGGLR